MRAMTAHQYRQEAERIRQLAEASASSAVRQRLSEIAQEYEAMAAKAEVSARDRPRRGG
jgi:hypothetical protein